MTPFRLLSIQTGRVQDVGGTRWRRFRSAIHKAPVSGPVRLERLGLEGDEQADPFFHGGPERALCVYAAENLARFRAELGLDLTPGAFGENFTVSGRTDEEVAVGDVYEVGEALVQITKPRGPCVKLARRWERPDLPRRVAQANATGWYMRVLREGLVEAGQELLLVEPGDPTRTIARENARKHGAR